MGPFLLATTQSPTLLGPPSNTKVVYFALFENLGSYTKWRTFMLTKWRTFMLTFLCFVLPQLLDGLPQ